MKANYIDFYGIGELLCLKRRVYSRNERRKLIREKDKLIRIVLKIEILFYQSILDQSDYKTVFEVYSNWFLRYCYWYRDFKKDSPLIINENYFYSKYKPIEKPCHK
jgi:hypothetical protein